jgi:hypothetical protein
MEFRARCSGVAGRRLWRRLKGEALSLMEQIAPICDARFAKLCCEPRAAELLAVGTQPSSPDREGVGGKARYYMRVCVRACVRAIGCVFVCVS